MKIGIISDTHQTSWSSGDVPDWVAAAFAGVDVIFHAGDVECAEFLLQLQTLAPVVAVRGNCDQSLSHLPHSVSYRLGRSMAVIAHRVEDARRSVDANTALMVYGHTHIPIIVREGNLLVVNPGSPSKPRGGNQPSVVVATFDGQRIEAEFKYR